MRHFVYITTDKTNGRKYVGAYSAQKPRDNYFGTGRLIRNIDKSNLSKKETEVDTIEQREELEVFIMDVIDSFYPNGYNKNRTGSKGSLGKEYEKERFNGKNNTFYGRKHSEEAKAKIAAANKGNKYSVGRKLSDETKEKIRQANMGKKLSEDHKRKISLGLKRKHDEKKRYG